MKKIGNPYLLSLILSVSGCVSDESDKYVTLSEMVPSSDTSFSDENSAVRSIAANMAEIEEMYDDLFRLRNNIQSEHVLAEMEYKINTIILCLDDCRKSVPRQPGDSSTISGGTDGHDYIRSYKETIAEITSLFKSLWEAAVSQNLDKYNRILYEIDEIKRKSHSRYG